MQSQRADLLQPIPLPCAQLDRTGSSIRSNSAGGSRRATTNSLLTTSRSSSLRRYAYGFALMSPRPSNDAKWRAVRLEPEEAWLRQRVIRLRSTLRYVKVAQVEIVLREIITDMEARLELLEAE